MIPGYAVVLLLAVGLISGCKTHLVTALHSLCPNGSPTIFDNSLIGVWNGDNPVFNDNASSKGSSDNVTVKERLDIKPLNATAGVQPRGYKIVYTDTEGRFTVLEGCLVEIGNLRILDTAVPAEEIPAGLQRSSVYPLHVFWKVDFLPDNVLMFSSLNLDWIRQAILVDRIDLPCEYPMERDFLPLLTAGPRKLREFFREYGGDPELFRGNGGAFRRAETAKPPKEN